MLAARGFWLQENAEQEKRKKKNVDGRIKEMRNVGKCGDGRKKKEMRNADKWGDGRTKRKYKSRYSYRDVPYLQR
jgi:hypothetical protein